MKRISLVALVLIVLTCSKAFSQGDCAQKLRLARSTYEQGRLHDLPALLEECLKGAFTTQEKEDAYKILTNAYIYLEEPDKADETMLKLLQNNNEFQPNREVDPAEFVALYNTFRTKPIYRIGGKAGTNATQPNVKSYSAINDGSAKYNYRFGFQAAASAEIPIFQNKLTLNPELYFKILSFDYTSTYDLENKTTTAIQTQNWISLPVSVQYEVYDGKYKPYVSAGVAADYLFGDQLKSVRTDKVDNSPVPDKTYDIKSQSNTFNLSAILSVGAKRKIGKGVAVAELRYHYGFSKITSGSNTFDNQNLIFDNQLVNGIYTLNSLSLSFGYLINVYNPKKLVHK
jgi:hypothetical protein